MNEKEAIEICKSFTPVIYVEHPEMFGSKWQVERDTRSIEAVETVLNLIEKQQTTINTMQAEFERLEDLEDNTDMLKMELKKKDKIIDLMANFILVLVPNRCYDEKPPAIMDIDWVKQYFERRIEQ